MSKITTKMVYTTTDTLSFDDPTKARNHQHALDIAEVIDFDFCDGTSLQLGEAVRDNWSKLKEIMEPFGLVQELNDPQPYVCTSIVPSGKLCQCSPCSANRQLKRRCPTCKHLKLVMNGEIWQCTGCGEIE